MLSVKLWHNPRILSIVRHTFISNMLKCEDTNLGIHEKYDTQYRN